MAILATLNTIPSIPSQVRTTPRALESMQLADAVASQVGSASRALESMRSAAAAANQMGAASRALESMWSAAQLLEVTGESSVASHGPSVEEAELDAEGQICAIEMLALKIEYELPQWLESNRSEL